MAMDARHRYMAQIVCDATGAAQGMVDAVIGDTIELPECMQIPCSTLIHLQHLTSTCTACRHCLPCLPPSFRSCLSSSSSRS